MLNKETATKGVEQKVPEDSVTYMIKWLWAECCRPLSDKRQSVEQSTGDITVCIEKNETQLSARDICKINQNESKTKHENQDSRKKIEVKICVVYLDNAFLDRAQKTKKKNKKGKAGNWISLKQTNKQTNKSLLCIKEHY